MGNQRHNPQECWCGIDHSREQRLPTPRRTTLAEDRANAHAWLARAEEEPEQREEFLKIAYRLDPSLRPSPHSQEEHFMPYVDVFIRVKVPWSSMLDKIEDEEYAEMSKTTVLDATALPDHDIEVLQIDVRRTEESLSIITPGA